MFFCAARSGTKQHSARFSALGEHGAVWFAIAAATRRWDAARTVAIAYGANQLIKLAVGRKRPAGARAGTLSNLSYPSAHAATSVAGARRLSETLPSLPLWALAAALATSRLYLGVHYPTDTLAGAALGASIAELTR